MICYLDTSAWIAWKFAQKGKEIFGAVSIDEDIIVSSPLLASEYISFLKRIDLFSSTRFEQELSFIQWIYPDKPMFAEHSICLKSSFIKGADLFHLSTALWFAKNNADELHFLSCDQKQISIAKVLGFIL